jgi:hypothetical protein
MSIMATEQYKKYTAYMKSKEWAIRRYSYFDTHNKQCRACDSVKLIQLHHKTYVRLGDERDQDLVPLCKKCHTALHTFQRKSGINLWRATEIFIKKKHSRRKTVQTNKRQSVHTRKKTTKRKTNAANQSRSLRRR